MADDTPFLARWSRRKVASRRAPPARPADERADERADEPAALDAESPRQSQGPAPTVAATRASQAPDAAALADPLPTLDDVAQLTRDSDFSRFVAPGVDEGVKRAAMKKLFADPHFNVMDGLDTYIDDYGKPNPIPMAVLRRMTQSKALGLFDDVDEAEPEAAPGLARAPSLEAAAPLPPDAESKPTPDDDADLQLQQDHAAGRPGPGEGAGA